MFFLYSVRCSRSSLALPFKTDTQKSTGLNMCGRLHARTHRRYEHIRTFSSRQPTSGATFLEARIRALKFVTGGVAGAIAAMIMTPLDVIRTNIQRSHEPSLKIVTHIVRTGGVRALFRGAGMSACMAVPAKSLSMQGYASFHALFGRSRVLSDEAVSLLAGLASGCVVALIMNPIAVVRTKIRCAQSSAGVCTVARRILNTEGVSGFFKGIAASLAMTSKNALQFMIYEMIKKCDRAHVNTASTSAPHARRETVGAGFAAGLSKVFATCLTYPLDSVRVLMTTSPPNIAKSKYRTIVSTVRAVIKTSGVTSLYRGLVWELLGSVPKTVILFVTYEAISKYLDAQRS